jgi:putative heme-binding domain-containing protein
VPELVKLQVHPNEWFARQARLQLAARAVSGRDLEEAKAQLGELFAREADVVIKLRAMWSLYAIGAADEAFLRDQLRHPDEHVRTWAIRLLSDFWPLDTLMSKRPTHDEGGASKVGARGLGNPGSQHENSPSSLVLKEFGRLAKSDPSALVRLALASVLQRLPVAERPALAKPLLAHAEDTKDHNLPLMLWYGLIPVGDEQPADLAKLAADCQIPLTRKLMARRLAEDIEKKPGPLNDLLSLASKRPESLQGDILKGLSEALRGWSKARKPEGWDGFLKKAGESSNATLRERIRDLSALFGDGRALDEVKRVALDSKAELAFRRAALQTLIEKRPPDLREICEQLLKVRFLNSTAIRGLALFDDAEIGEKLAGSYREFHPSERGVVMETLVSRPAFARALLEEMGDQRIPRSDMTPFHARQIRSFNDPSLTRQLAEVWGELRDSPAEKQQLITHWKSKLTAATLASADKSNGRIVFNKTCAACHTLYGHGGQVGPDLTGSGRDNLDYLLDNIVDPSAVVNADFRMTVVELKDGRTLNGLVASRTERTVTLKTMTETVTIERAQIEGLHESSLSLMPEGLLETLSEKEVRDLIAYLRHPVQVP